MDDIAFQASITSTRDLQSDYAAMMATVANYPDSEAHFKPTIDAYKAELEKRGEPVPTNCRWVLDIYSRNKQKLEYDLEETDA